MATMYDDLSTITNSILTAISQSDRLDEYLRLVAYDGDDALDGSPTLPTFSELMWDRQFPFIKPLDPQIEKGTYVMVYYKDGGFSGSDNIFQHDGNFKFEFLCHKDNWCLDNKKVRPYELSGVVYEILRKMDLQEAIRGKFVVGAPSMLVTHNGQYAGYSFNLKFTGATKC